MGGDLLTRMGGVWLPPASVKASHVGVLCAITSYMSTYVHMSCSSLPHMVWIELNWPWDGTWQYLRNRMLWYHKTLVISLLFVSHHD